MDFQIGDITLVEHYSSRHHFYSTITETDLQNGQFSLKLTKDFAFMSFLENDPVVLHFRKQGKLYVVGCNLEKIDTKKNTVMLKIDTIEEENDNRKEERYPVSLYGEVVTNGLSKKSTVTVKDISIDGFCICSKEDYVEEEILNIVLFLENSVLFFKTKAVWKKTLQGRNEYGLSIIFETRTSLGTMRDLVKRLKVSRESMLR